MLGALKIAVSLPGFSSLERSWRVLALALLCLLLAMSAHVSQAATINVDGGCALSDAITAANTNSTVSNSSCEAGEGGAVVDIIRLRQDASLASSTPDVSSKMIVDGMGKTVSVAAGATDVRLFRVDSAGDLTLRNITISGGNANQGAAIHSSGNLTMEDCVLKDSAATLEGGGIHIWTSNSVATINRCSFINNRSDATGGAIDIENGQLTVTNSSFFGNSCARDGCAIHVAGDTATLAQNTFWNNKTDGSSNSSAVYVDSGTVNLLNSILGRDAQTSAPLCGGTIATSSGNLVWNDAANSTACGTVTAEAPLLGASTGFPPYMPLGAGSPARGAGVNATCAAYPTDQRGASRPATNCDIGALQFIDESAGRARRRGNPPEPEPSGCTGEGLNANSGIRVSATYDICSGINFERRDIAAIGIQWIIDAGPLDVVDVWGWVRPTAEVCFPQPGSMLFLNASMVQRVVEPLPSYRDGQYTCAQIGVAGTLILMPADSPHTTPPSAGPQTPLAGCMARTNYILNLRAAPGGDVITLLPYDVTLTAYAKAGSWYEVDYHGIRGWVSGDYVTLVGACA